MLHAFGVMKYRMRVFLSEKLCAQCHAPMCEQRVLDLFCKQGLRHKALFRGEAVGTKKCFIDIKLVNYADGYRPVAVVMVVSQRTPDDHDRGVGQVDVRIVCDRQIVRNNCYVSFIGKCFYEFKRSRSSVNEQRVPFADQAIGKLRYFLLALRVN